MAELSLKDRIESLGVEDNSFQNLQAQPEINESWTELRTPRPTSKINTELDLDRHAAMVDQVHGAFEYLRQHDPDQGWAQRELNFSILDNVYRAIRSGDNESLTEAIKALGRQCSSITK